MKTLRQEILEFLDLYDDQCNAYKAQEIIAILRKRNVQVEGLE